MRALLLALCLAGIAQAAPTREGSIVRVEHRDPFALPSRGPANALVTIELFVTPGQSSRQQIYKALERLQAAHPSRIRLVYRIVDSGGQKRLPRAALYAYSEGKFFDFMDAVNVGAMNPDDKALAAIAKKVGLDWDRMYNAITKPPAAYERVLADNEVRRRQRFPTTPPSPNVLFNGKQTENHTSSLGATDLEREYQKAKEAAEELLDHGIARSELGAAFEQMPPPLDSDIAVQRAAIDEELDDNAANDDAVLATPPLDLRDWPSYGPAKAETTIVVMCSPTSGNCRAPMGAARVTRDKYPSSIRVVWAPLFNVTGEEAADLSLLADAAACAEKVGTTVEGRDDSAFDDAASPGWRWVEAVLAEANSRRRELEPEKLIERVAAKLHVDRPAFATCRAQVAGTSVKWIEAARHAGARVTPNTAVGGRLYGPVTDLSTLQSLVQAELAPGLLAPSWMQPDEKQ